MTERLFVVENDLGERWLVYAKDGGEAVKAFMMKKIAEAILKGRDADLGSEIEATLAILHPSYYLFAAEAAMRKVETAEEVMRWANEVWEEKRREFLMKKQEKQLTLAEVGVV